MGGRGSGRQSNYRGRPQTRDALPLDIRKITRKGLLVPGMRFSWQWLVNDLVVASISIRIGFRNIVALAWRVIGTGEVVEQWVQTHTSPCHLGGQRHWFTCPRCGTRVAVLYAPSRDFICRRCGGLAYATQSEDRGDRAATKANKLRTRLGWEIGILNMDGPKPKGMHWKTYHRLKAEHDRLVEFSLSEMDNKLYMLKGLFPD